MSQTVLSSEGLHLGICTLRSTEETGPEMSGIYHSLWNSKCRTGEGHFMGLQPETRDVSRVTATCKRVSEQYRSSCTKLALHSGLKRSNK